MIAPITPGAYLKLRRKAAGLILSDVAARVSTDPHTPEHLRVDQLELIEADIQPAGPSTIMALRRAFPFSVWGLTLLARIAQGDDLAAPRLCRICACSELDACDDRRGGPCGWAEADLCTSCTPASLERLGLDALATRTQANA